ncbi:hypothetical protein QVD17_03392 [Tagetes erecta]|uniref:Fanconi Anaemia group E protein C-terminal domain-containing protein n=1 Tax=Tagetes erecta TaxID=13708 RepID=A0AAD8P8M1_TARER|nr:hypothetical protein QVD17_03392 [Tagetes erecta]
MESWVPLMKILMKSVSPETEASQSSTCSCSFLSLLMQPTPSKHTFMWLQTLPDTLQARILSFLIYNHTKFNNQLLSKLARELLSNAPAPADVDFWVKRGARQLFDVVSHSNFKWGLNLDSEEEKFEEKFGSMPAWLNDAANANANPSLLSWLPISVDDDINTRMSDVTSQEEEEEEEEDDDEVDGVDKLVCFESDPIDDETKEMALCLNTKILNMESSLIKAAELADEVRILVFKKKTESLAVLSLIEPWRVDDEIVPVLLSRFFQDHFVVASNILCSLVLPKLLELEKPAARVLVTATIDYCKVHHKSAVYALLIPLILHKNGINNPMCDVITRIVKECLHPAHVSAICQKLLLCEENTNGKEYICLPCYQHLLSKSLLWTESLFNLFQIILNHHVRLTQDSVNQLVFHVQESAIRPS